MLRLEPIFCKSTGAYRAQVSRFCNSTPTLEGKFRLAKAQKPSSLDSDAWVAELPLGTLRWGEHVQIQRGARSVLQRADLLVTTLIDSRRGFILEVHTDDVTPAGVVIAALKAEEGRGTSVEVGFESMAITLIRHGMLTLNGAAKLRSSVTTGLFQAENAVETLELDGRRLARAVLTGRILDVSENPVIAELVATKQIVEVEEENREAFEGLCRMGLFRQIWSLK